jgi:preprotein translocase subunit SecY
MVVAAIVFVERGQRRIPVQYAKRMVGRRMVQGQSNHLPLRVNPSGVIPVIFAGSIIALPQTFTSMFPTSPWMSTIAQRLAWGMPLYTLLYVVGIIFFCYFYTAIIFNPADVADNLRKYGGYIPGIRPGRRTGEYIDTILTRLTLCGAVYLAVVAVLPELLMAGLPVAPIPVIGPWLDSILPGFMTEGLGITFAFGGTSLLIVVGVAMDTVQQIETQLIMRHYEGFMRRGRVRGRRG